MAALWLAGLAPSREGRRTGATTSVPPAAAVAAVFAVVNLVVPWPLVAGATGLVFGTAAGTPLALAGVLLGSTLQFLIARTGRARRCDAAC